MTNGICTDTRDDERSGGELFPQDMFLWVRLLAAALLLLICLLINGPIMAQPLAGTAEENFATTLHKMNPEDFGTLKLYKKNVRKKEYGKAEAGVDALLQDEKRRTWRQPWEELRDSFVSVAISSPKADLSAQAVHRAAQCQEALAAHSRAAQDWRLAVGLYESVARRYGSSKYAADALLAAARISLANLNNTRSAKTYLDWLLDQYRRSSAAPAAKELKNALSRSSAEGRECARDMTLRQARRGNAKLDARTAHLTKAAPALEPQRPVQKTAPARAAGPLTITIDAGHGGSDPGTVHHGVYEKDITLDVALRLGKLLKDNGINVNYTRTRNQTVSLHQRTAFANAKGSDLFISIHVNANLSAQVRGLEVYYLDTSPTAPTVVADRENGTSGKTRAVRGQVRQSQISNRILASSRLARIVRTNLHVHILKSGHTIECNGVRKAPFYVLATASMPSVLVEIGYLSNPGDAALLKSTSYRQAVAEGLAESINAWRWADRQRMTADRKTETKTR